MLWENTSTGERVVWLMSGPTHSGYVSLGIVPTEWRIAGSGDFNSDGNADIVWENTSTGERGIWTMNGNTVTGFISFGTVPTEWRIAGVADFNGDGNPDILWDNTTTGDRGVWMMHGTSVAGFTDIGGVSLEWHMVGAADFTGDGKPDVLWENVSTGDRGIWRMQGTTILGFTDIGGVPLEWHIAGAADFFGDGQNDILWRNQSTGEAGVWRMSGTSVTGFTSSGVVPVEWQLRGAFQSAPSTAPVATITVTIANPYPYVGQQAQATATLRDANGNVLTGRPVTWLANRPAIATIDANGLVTAVAPGQTQFDAMSEGKDGPVSVTVDPAPNGPPVASISLVINQPALRVAQSSPATATLRDANGNVLTDRIVRWSSSDPNVAISSCTCGSVNSVFAEGAGTATITVLSEQKTASATVTVTTTDPPFSVHFNDSDQAGVTRDTLAVFAAVTSQYDIQSVVASYGNRTATLAPGTGCTNSGVCFTGTLILTGVAGGLNTLTVSATDIHGAVAQANKSLRLDRAPSVVVQLPTSEFVVRNGSLHVVATCTDLDGDPCTIVVHRGEFATYEIIMAQGPGPTLDVTIPVASRDGQSVALIVDAHDQYWTSPSVFRQTYAEASPNLHDFTSTPGKVYDADATRVLYVDTASTIHLATIGGGTDQAIFSLGASMLTAAYLTARGAIFSIHTKFTTPSDAVYEWRDNSLVTVSSAGGPVVARGDYAIWSEGNTLQRRTISTSANQVMATNLAGGSAVGDNGEVAYVAPQSVILTGPSGGTASGLQGSLAPTTDGTLALFADGPTGGPYVISMLTQGTTTLLSSNLVSRQGCGLSTTANNSAVQGGWAAFLSPSMNSGVAQVWTRAPDGTLRQVSALGSDSFVTGLEPTGGVFFAAACPARQYHSLPPYSTSLDIGGPWQVVFRGGQSYVLIGRSVYTPGP